MIKPCHCENPYQDEKYGKGNRVHIAAHKGGYFRAWVCTVCKHRKNVQPANSKVKLSEALELA